MQKIPPQWLVVVGLGILLGWQLYLLGAAHAEHGVRGSYRHYQMLKDREAENLAYFDELQDEISARDDQLFELDQRLQLETMTNRELRRVLSELQETQRKQEERIRFYEGIVGGGRSTVGARVDSFSVRRIADSLIYHVELLVVRTGQSTGKVTGKATLSLLGSQSGEVVELSLFKEATKGYRRLGFQHFQTVEAEFPLPEDMVPAEFRLHIEVGGRGSEPIDLRYQWSDVVTY